MHGEVERRAPAEPGQVVIDLHRAALRQEGVVGKVGAEQEQQVGLMSRVVAGAVPQQPAHTHVIRVVVLDPLLAAQRVADRTLQPSGQRHDLGVGAPHARAAEERHGARGIKTFGELAHLIMGGHHRPPHGHGRALAGGTLRGPMEHVARHDQHGDAAAADRVLDRDACQAWHLRRLAHQLAVVTALDEEPLGMSLLEERRPDLLRRDV